MKIKNSSSKRYLFIGLFAIICAVAVSGNLYLLNKSKARIKIHKQLLMNLTGILIQEMMENNQNI